MRRIAVVVEVFGDEHVPIVAAGYRPATRHWDRAGAVRPVSVTYVRQCRQSGYTRLRLALDGRQKEFTVEELLG